MGDPLVSIFIKDVNDLIMLSTKKLFDSNLKTLSVSISLIWKTLAFILDKLLSNWNSKVTIFYFKNRLKWEFKLNMKN